MTTHETVAEILRRTFGADDVVATGCATRILSALRATPETADAGEQIVRKVFELKDGSQTFIPPGPAGAGLSGEALEPFAKIADEYSDHEDDDFQIWKDCDQPQTRVTLGQCRKARTAILSLVHTHPEHRRK